MSTMDDSALEVIERNDLLSFEHCHISRRWNDKLHELYVDIDIVQRIKQLRWLNHAVRLNLSAAVLKVFDTVLAGGSRRSGRQPLCENESGSKEGNYRVGHLKRKHGST